MTKRINLSIKALIVFVVTALFFFISTGVKAESQEIDNQLTILYMSEEHDFSDIDVDRSRISSVEKVSDIVDVVHLKDSNDATDLIEEIKKNKSVRAVDYEAIGEIESIPNDKFYEKYQGYLKNMGYENVIVGNKTAKVAVVDTGVDATHEDLVGRVENSGYNYVDDNYDTSDLEGHGTFISGVISAKTNNNIGIAGASGEANVMIVPYVTLNENGEGELSDIAAALESISKRDDIQVINLSLGFDSKNAVLEASCQNLADQGKIIVASSGNYEENYLMYPARYASTISVGAVNENDERCDPDDWGDGQGSNYGEGLDIMAPGNDLASLASGNKYILGSGTSYSAPLVSAACALAITNGNKVNLSSVRETIQATSKDLLTPGWDEETGYGLLQLDSFVNQFRTVTEQPIYRLYLPSNNEHLYTSNANEVKELTKLGWRDEGTAWISPVEGEPVYRLYHDGVKEHLYTKDINEVNVLSTRGWTIDNEGSPIFYSGGDRPIYRLYNSAVKRHLLTMDVNEYNVLGAANWNKENVALNSLN